MSVRLDDTTASEVGTAISVTRLGSRLPVRR